MFIFLIAYASDTCSQIFPGVLVIVKLFGFIANSLTVNFPKVNEEA